MDNNSSTSRRFIFDENFYSNLEDTTSKLPEQKDPFAPITEVKKEVKPEEEKPVEIEMPIEDKKTVIEEPKVIEEVKVEPIEEVKPEIKIVEDKKETEMVEVKDEPVQEEVNLNVNSGIDRNLENELMHSRVRQDMPIISEFPIFEEQPRTAYKAVRRRNTVTTEETKPVENVVKPIEPVKVEEPVIEEKWEPPYKPDPITIREEIEYYQEDTSEVFKSDLLDKLKEKSEKTGEFSILARYGDDFCSHDYVTNPAIGRDNEIKSLGLILLMPEKSAILVGKPGIGKTSIVEGLAYRLQRNQMPEALKGYTIISIKTASLLGKAPNGETKLQTLVDEIKTLDKVILFIDEIHMLIEAQDDSNLDFANLFKESLGRGSIKMIGATTTEEYERYILRDKAFVRRFQRVDVKEANKEETVEIVMGTLPKIEKATGAKMKYTHYIQAEIVRFVVDITSEYKRVYGIGSRYPDICLTLMSQAFSEAVFDNRTEVNILDIRNAISKSKNIYPDVIKKELVNFDKQFKELIDEAI